jgi:hypothetical protein
MTPDPMPSKDRDRPLLGVHVLVVDDHDDDGLWLLEQVWRRQPRPGAA